MKTAKLKTPFFYKGQFNHKGHRMRSLPVREVSNGADTFQLWRHDGAPDHSYPRTENDAYILYTDLGGYLMPLGMTEYELINRCGYAPAIEMIYGGEEQRNAYISQLRIDGMQDTFPKALEREDAETLRLGSDPSRQADFIKSLINSHVEAYLTAKENGGQTFPDFIGALALDELDNCKKLKAVYQAKREAERAIRKQKIRNEEIALVEQKNAEAEQKVAEAISILQHGGILKNNPIQLYTLTDDSYKVSTYSLVNYLLRRFDIETPLRTQGWINRCLQEAAISNGRCSSYRYQQAKNAKGSSTIFDCLAQLIQAVQVQEAA